jgi:hypothetical protein
MADSVIPPKYNVAIVEALILEVTAEAHPQRLTVAELSARIVSDPDDSRETETVIQALRGLREFGLLRDHDNETAEPTPAALHAVALLAT